VKSTGQLEKMFGFWIVPSVYFSVDEHDKTLILFSPEPQCVIERNSYLNPNGLVLAGFSLANTFSTLGSYSSTYFRCLFHSGRGSPFSSSSFRLKRLIIIS
jgi:hypothetical protein